MKFCILLLGGGLQKSLSAWHLQICVGLLGRPLVRCLDIKGATNAHPLAPSDRESRPHLYAPRKKKTGILGTKPFSAVLRLSRIFGGCPENFARWTKHFRESVSGLVPKVWFVFWRGWVGGVLGKGRGGGGRAFGVAQEWFRPPPSKNVWKLLGHLMAWMRTF